MVDRRIYVGNLPYSVTEGQLRELFAKHGQVKAVEVKRGFAFVEMSEEDADKAIQALTNTELEGRKMVVERARGEETAEKVEYSITSLKASKPVWVDGVAVFEASVKVSYRGRYLPKKTMIVVFDFLREVFEEETNDVGVASMDFNVSGPTSVLLGAQIKDMPETRKTLPVLVLPRNKQQEEHDNAKLEAETATFKQQKREAEKKGKPEPAVVKEIMLQHSGKPGDYEIVGQVVAEGVVGPRKIRISEARGLEAEVINETDENGCFKFSAKFRELERTYLVTDIGSGLTKRIRLFGSPY